MSEGIKQERKSVRKVLTDLVCSYFVCLDQEKVEYFLDTTKESEILKSKDTILKLQEWCLTENKEVYNLEKDILSYILGDVVDWYFILEVISKKENKKNVDK